MIVLGIDVAKAKLDAALWIAATRKWYACKVDNDGAGIHKLLTWMAAKSGRPVGDICVVLEATGVYHEAAAQALHDAGCKVVIANPKRARDFAKGLGLLSKTDTIDARALARYGELGEAQAWQPPPPEVRMLRALLARLAAVEEDLRREENRWEKAQISDTPEIVRDSLQRSLETLHLERKRLRRAIDDHHDQHPGLKAERELLMTIPAVGKASADQLLCLLRGRTLGSARQAAALSGLVPVEYTSGTSVRGRPRLSKQGNPKLRAVLYMASIVALKHNPELRAIYDRLVASGKVKMAALGALMRHIVHIAFGMLKHQQPYNPKLVSKKA
ncbi:MAG TPA: IS110 family transposase [Solimonas sp.]|nr:IS110 family transposase [Solimonas sp.]